VREGVDLECGGKALGGRLGRSAEEADYFAYLRIGYQFRKHVSSEESSCSREDLVLLD
jgi:hypothetical protein